MDNPKRVNGVANALDALQKFSRLARITTAPHGYLDQLLSGKHYQKFEELFELQKTQGPDPFGMDIQAVRNTLAFASIIYENYFRCETEGIEHIPKKRAILVANHAGQLPFDAMMISTAVALESDTPRICRSMMDRFVPTLPFVSTWFTRLGVVVGTRNNARRLLDSEEALLTFPEGITAIQKPLSKAYQLQEFGLGFMRLALQTGTPIVPVAVVGSEEQYPTLYTVKSGTRMFNSPMIPIWAHMALPFIGLLPLPVKYHIEFCEPLTFKGDPDDEDAVIGDMAAKVRSRINETLVKIRERRKSVFY